MPEDDEDFANQRIAITAKIAERKAGMAENKPIGAHNVSCSTHTCGPAPKLLAAKPKARYPYLPNARSTTRARGNDYRGWALFQMVALELLMVKLFLDV